MSTSEIVDDILAHVGVKGMKWGVRKAVDTAIGTKTAGRRPSSYKSGAAKAAQTRRRNKAGDTALAGFGITTTGSRKRSAARSGSQAVKVMDKRKKIKTSGGQGRPAHPDALRAHRLGQVAKKSGTKALSNDELQAYTKRLQLETSLKRLNNEQRSTGHKFAKGILKTSGDKAVQEVTGGAMKLVKSHLFRTFK